MELGAGRRATWVMLPERSSAWGRAPGDRMIGRAGRVEELRHEPLEDAESAAGSSIVAKHSHLEADDMPSHFSATRCGFTILTGPAENGSCDRFSRRCFPCHRDGHWHRAADLSPRRRRASPWWSEHHRNSRPVSCHPPFLASNTHPQSPI